MSIQHANRGIVKKDLQLYYNREFSKSFRGEATTNIVSNTTDFSGLSYAGYENEWTSNPTRFTKSYNSTLQTPIGTGATLLTESGTDGYHHLSRFGGSGEGGNSISCYVYSVNGSITNFAIGMLGDGGSTAIFNLVTGTVVSTGARVSNAFITKVSGWLGWYRVGANIGGRTGGWVGAVGLDVQTSYTPSLPYKSMYVTGMQYESKTYCTPFVVGSNRSANTVAAGGGLLDISGNNVNADLTNVSFNNTGYFFNGASSNRIIAKTYTATDPFWLNLGSISIWFKTSTNQNGVLVGWGDDGNTNFGSIEITADWTGGYADESLIAESYTASASQRAVIRKGSNYYANGVWTNITAVFDDNYLNLKIYINGVLETTSNNGSSSGAPFLNVSTSTSYFNIGRRTYGAGGEYFTGEIGQVLVYGRLLTAAEVLQNFNATRKTYGI
jgi:hypothetical protein